MRYGQTYRVGLSFKQKTWLWIVSRIVIVILIYHRHKPTDLILEKVRLKLIYPCLFFLWRVWRETMVNIIQNSDISPAARPAVSQCNVIARARAALDMAANEVTIQLFTPRAICFRTGFLAVTVNPNTPVTGKSCKCSKRTERTGQSPSLEA
jgi:hypothetical protein